MQWFQGMRQWAAIIWQSNSTFERRIALVSLLSSALALISFTAMKFEVEAKLQNLTPEQREAWLSGRHQKPAVTGATARPEDAHMERGAG